MGVAEPLDRQGTRGRSPETPVLPGFDALRATRWRRTFAPFGVRLHVQADRAALLDTVAAVCDGMEEEGPATGSPVLRLCLVLGGDPGVVGDPQIVIDRHRMTMTGAGVEVHVDAVAGVAHCRLSRGWAGHAALADRVLEPVLLFLLARNGRVPLHAAAFYHGDTAILLAGSSGAGKSCLALAAHRAGYALLSDDTVFVAVTPGLRLYGRSEALHVFPEDAPPEPGPLRRRGGRLKRIVPLPMRAAAPWPSRAAVCILSRGDRVSLTRIGAAAANADAPPLEPGFDLLAGDIARVWGLLTQRGAWRLMLSHDPAAAIGLLGEAMPRLIATAVS